MSACHAYYFNVIIITTKLYNVTAETISFKY